MSGAAEKRCSECGQVKSPAGFSRNRAMADGLEYQCKECRRIRSQAYHQARREQNAEGNRARARAWAAANPERARAVKEQGYQAVRNAVLDHYGRLCACCGETAQLTIDHVNGGGRDHRAQIGHGANRLYRWLIANGFPDGFQTLCFPCNRSKGKGDCCQISHSALAEVTPWLATV